MTQASRVVEPKMRPIKGRAVACANAWGSVGDWAAIGMAVVFTAIFTVLMSRKHETFHTFALDLAKFNQAIWNTLHGRFLFSTLQNHSILGNHFSPYLALLSPLFLIWPDPRVLFLVQTAGLAVAGLILYLLVRVRRPAIAPWFLLAFYMNPALHDVALKEFRRVVLAVPWLALASYGLYVRKRWLMVLGLGVALLCKENISVVILMFGVYLILFERDWKWGAPIVLVGSVWAVVITFVLVPYLWRSTGDGSGPVLRTYKQINYYCLEGETHSEMLAYVLHNPLVLIGRVFDKMTLSTLWRILLPLGVVLPFLAPDWLLIVVPSVVIMLMSCYDLRKMTGWYTASILPALFAAVAVGLDRRSERHSRWLVGGLVCATIVGFALFSHAPLGAQYEPSLYAFTPHHRLAAQVVAAVPDDARVAAQDPYVPHLAHREHIYMYPWIAGGLDNVDYVLLDRKANPYPLSPSRRDSAIDDLVADTRFVVEMEVDGIYLFHHEGVPLPAYSLGQVADEAMKLDRVEIAIRDEEGFYRVTAEEPLALRPGQHVRISLYWEALSDLKAERTISIRFADASGALLAQRDSMPGQGKKPTSWWREGWNIRDVYYMTLPPETPAGPGELDILVYDTYSSGAVLWEDGSAVLRVVDVEIESSP